MRPTDMNGVEIRIWDKVVRAIKACNAPMLDICRVTKVDSDGKVYLDNSKNPIVYPEYLLVLKS